MAKYRREFGLALSEAQNIKRCEKFASKGYKLVSVNSFGFHKFERSQPEEVSFVVNYTNKPLKNEELAEYIQIFENSDWSYVCSHDGTCHYFKAEKGSTPIYTDDATKLHKFEVLHKDFVKYTIIGITIMALDFALPAITPLYYNPFLQILEIARPLLRGSGFSTFIIMVASIFSNNRQIAAFKKNSSLS